MAKIVRYDGNLKAFASEQQTNERTLFGQVTIANDLTSQITSQFLRGWGIVGPSDQPSLQDFNAAMYTNGQLLAYLHQMGVAEYNAAQEYFVGSLSQTEGVLYISRTNANIGNAPATSPAQWKAFTADQATEVALGLVKIATQTMVADGVDDQAAITSKKRAVAAQIQASCAFASTGTATAQVLSPTPAISAYAVSQRFNVTFNVSSGANPTINVSGQGAKFLKQYNTAGAKVAASFSAGQVSDIVYDGTDFILLNQMASTTGTTRPQFDSSTSLATTAFVQGVGLQFTNILVANGNVTLNAASNAGGLVVADSGTQIAVALPLATTMPSRTTITLWSYASGGMRIAPAGTDSIYTPDAVSVFFVPVGTYVTFASNGVNGWYAIGVQKTIGITGSAKNLKGLATGLSASAAYTADEILVSSSTQFQTLRSVSVSASLLVAGANGLDTGSSVASTWYSFWVIWNGTSVSGLFSLSGTSPLMPSGYTHKARVGWVRTDATTNKFPLSFVQADRSVRYKVAAGSNVASTPILAAGSMGNVTTPVWAATSTSQFVPPTAISIAAMLNTTGGFRQMVAPNGNYGSFSSISNPAPLLSSSGASAAYMSIVQEIILETSSVYVASEGANIFCIGWEDAP